VPLRTAAEIAMEGSSPEKTLSSYSGMVERHNEARRRATLNQQQFAQQQQPQPPPKAKGPTHRCTYTGCPAEGLQKSRQAVLLHEGHIESQPEVKMARMHEAMVFDLLYGR